MTTAVKAVKEKEVAVVSFMLGVASFMFSSHLSGVTPDDWCRLPTPRFVENQINYKLMASHQNVLFLFVS